MTEPTTEPGRALLGLDMAPESGYWVSLGAYEMRAAILAIEAAAAEAERARIRALVEDWAGFPGFVSAAAFRNAVLAAIDDEAKG